MNSKTVLVGLGEILWDLFPDGARFGGAPANFTCSAAGLGGDSCDVFIVSALGTDELGDRAIASLVEHGVKISQVARNSRPTGQVHVKLDGHGHATYEFEPDAAWDRLEWTTELAQLANRTNAVCFGTLGQRSDESLATIRRFVSATPVSALRIFDINVRKPFVSDDVILDSLRLANILKLNDEELPVLAKLFGLNGSPIAMLQQLAEQFAFQAIALTRGEHGAILLRGEEICEEPGIETLVVDTVGAGDAFTATFAIGLLQGQDLRSINRRACQVASYVCSQRGATPKIPDRLTWRTLLASD